MKISAFFLSLFAVSASAHAEDVLLYDAPPPADAAFVRFIGVEGGKHEWKDLTFQETSENRLSDYFIVHADAIGFSPGDILTVLPKDIVILEPKKNPAKVTLGLVNLSNDIVELKAKNGQVTVIPPVEPNEVGWREVNPVSVDLQAFIGQKAINSPKKFTFHRNEHPTLVVSSDGNISDIISHVSSGIVE